MISTFKSYGHDVGPESISDRRLAFQRALAAVEPQVPRPKSPTPPAELNQCRKATETAPRACLVACDDGSVDLASIAGCDPQELAVVQCPGVNVPMIGPVDGAAAAEVQLALALGVRELILCGVGPATASTPSDAVEAAPAASWSTNEPLSGLSTARPLGTALAWADVRRRMLLECRRLRAIPAVSQKLSEGALRLHVWIHNPQTGELLAYDGRLARFVPLGSRVGESPVERARLPRN